MDFWPKWDPWIRIFFFEKLTHFHCTSLYTLTYNIWVAPLPPSPWAESSPTIILVWSYSCFDSTDSCLFGNLNWNVCLSRVPDLWWPSTLHSPALLFWCYQSPIQSLSWEFWLTSKQVSQVSLIHFNVQGIIFKTGFSLLKSCPANLVLLSHIFWLIFGRLSYSSAFVGMKNCLLACLLACDDFKVGCLWWFLHSTLSSMQFFKSWARYLVQFPRPKIWCNLS